MEITWRCPICGRINLDDTMWTVNPMCFNCGLETPWERIQEANDCVEWPE